MTDSITYSVVVPVHNSEVSLNQLCDQIIDTLAQHTFEIIFVDDGSTDKSWHIITRLKNEHPSIIRAIRLQKNFGQHAATSCAFGFCKGSFVITIDDDLQYGPKDILLLIQKQKERHADVVYGMSSNKKHSGIRNLGSKYVQFESRIFEGNTNRPSSFRLLDKKIVQAIATHHTNSFMYLDNIISWYTSSFAFVEVAHYPRLSGKSGYNIIKLLRIHLSAIMNYSVVPLKAMTYFGFIFSIISFLFGVHFVYMKLFHEVPIGYTSIIVAVLFCSGIIMFCLGIIGQYLFRLHTSQQNKPLYSIKDIL